MVFGTIAIIDLRLLGFASANRRYTEMARELLPWTWGAWVVSAIFGTPLIASHPVAYFANTDFRLKFLAWDWPASICCFSSSSPPATLPSGTKVARR
jgi:hypothetical protein